MRNYEENNILKNPRFYISIALIMFFFFFAKQVPYSHDDWQWASQAKWDLMLNGFENYNGRYLGNLLEILITRNVFAKNISLSVGMLAIIWVIYKFINNNAKAKDKTALFILTSLLCLSMPRELFRQTYSWIAAFINFVPPVILIVLYLLIVRKAFKENDYSPSTTKYPIWATLLMIPLGISTQLFSEHTTVYVVALAGFIVFYTYMKYRRLSSLQVVYLVSVIIGAVIMFSNGAYLNAASNTDGYKEISTSALSVVDLYVNQISSNLFLNNYLLNALIAILCVIIVQKFIKDSRFKRITTIGNIQIFILSTYALYSICHKLYPVWNIFTDAEKTANFNAIYSLVFFFTVLSVILIYIEDFGLKMNMFMIYGSSLAVAMPLIVAQPIGPRCFFASYIFMIITILQLLVYILGDSNFDFSSFSVMLGSLLVMLCVYYASIFVDVGVNDRYREKIINEALSRGDKSITLYRLPYENYFWTTVPPDAHWESFFKEFYNIPQDVRLEFK